MVFQQKQMPQGKRAGAKKPIDRRIAVAPMMGWTDRHDRYFLRLISPNALLYTVMLTSGALLHGDAARFLQFDPAEHPVALQLGGSDPQELAKAAKMGETAGYDEINLNCGCPSDRVQRGAFGACMMKQPALVADCIAAMNEAVDVPVTVKTRIGVDEYDSYDFLCDFIGQVSEKGGCDVFIIHARKAWLKGLNPKQNRTVPPLRWDIVHRLKKDFPQLTVILNGGLDNPADVREQLQHSDGVMIGREAYQNPYFLAALEEDIFGTPTATLRSRHDTIRALLPYIEAELSKGTQLYDITRHILGLFQGLPGAKKWRRILSEKAFLPSAGPEVVLEALSHVAEIGNEKRYA